MVCVQILGLLGDWFLNLFQNYSVVYYGLLCGIFCGYLYTTIGLEDQVVIA